MFQKKCHKCGKVIEGFTKKHVASMMYQHEYKHKKEVANVKKKKTGQ